MAAGDESARFIGPAEVEEFYFGGRGDAVVAGIADFEGIGFTGVTVSLILNGVVIAKGVFNAVEVPGERCGLTEGYVSGCLSGPVFHFEP